MQKKKKYKKREQIEALTAGEAIEKMLEKKKISTKINYDVLRDLNKGTGSPGATPTDPPETAATRKRINRRRRRKTSEANQDLAADASILGKRYRSLLRPVIRLWASSGLHLGFIWTWSLESCFQLWISSSCFVFCCFRFRRLISTTSRKKKTPPPVNTCSTPVQTSVQHLFVASCSQL